MGSAEVPPAPLQLPRQVRCHHSGSFWWGAATHPLRQRPPSPRKVPSPQPKTVIQSVEKSFDVRSFRKVFREKLQTVMRNREKNVKKT